MEENMTYQALQKMQFQMKMTQGNRESRPEAVIQENISQSMRQNKTMRKSKKEQSLSITSTIEFFDPIKTKKTLSKKIGKIKDKGSTQKHGQKSKVPTDNSTQDEHGMINFYGNVSKQRFKYNKFHNRWIVLRGFFLYWYRSPLDKSQKGMIILPSINIQASKVR